MSVACTLSPRDLPARRALIEGLARDALLGRAVSDSGLRIRLRDTPEIDRRVRELVAAESRCCPFLDFALGRSGGELVLDVSGAVEARALVEMFLAA